MDVTALDIFQFCRCLRHAGKIMLLVVVGLVGTIYYAVMASVLVPGTQAGSGGQRVASTLGMVIYSALIFMLVWCYLATWWTHPGAVPLGWQPFGDEEVRAATTLADLSNGCLHSLLRFRALATACLLTCEALAFPALQTGFHTGCRRRGWWPASRWTCCCSSMNAGRASKGAGPTWRDPGTAPSARCGWLPVAQLVFWLPGRQEQESGNSIASTTGHPSDLCAGMETAAGPS